MDLNNHISKINLEKNDTIKKKIDLNKKKDVIKNNENKAYTSQVVVNKVEYNTNKKDEYKRYEHKGIIIICILIGIIIGVLLVLSINDKLTNNQYNYVQEKETNSIEKENIEQDKTEQDVEYFEQQTDVSQELNSNSEEIDAFSISDEELEREIEIIRNQYYSPTDRDTKKIFKAGDNEWDFSREYYYHDGILYFAFVFKGSTEEHRLYFKDNHMIRYIDEFGVEHNFGSLENYNEFESKVLSEAY